MQKKERQTEMTSCSQISIVQEVQGVVSLSFSLHPTMNTLKNTQLNALE